MAAGGDSGGRGTRAVAAAMVANLAVGAATSGAFAVTGAASLLAVSIHSVAGTGNQALLLLGGRKAKRQAGALHPFGYGRERYFWAFVVAIVLFMLGAVFAIYEGLRKIEQPEPLAEPTWAFGVLGFAIVAEGLSFRTAVRAANRTRGRASWWRFIRNAKSPELPVVLLEDTGALAGLVIALGAIVTSEVTGNPVWDGIGTLAIGVLLAIIAIVLVTEMKSLLIGEAASRKEVESIQAAVEIDPAVRSLLHMRTQHQGPEELLVGMKVELDHTLTFPEVSEVVNRLERNVRRAVPAARIMYVEPDVDVGRRAAPTIGEHGPVHDVPDEIRAKRKLEDQRGALGVGIPLEADDR